MAKATRWTDEKIKALKLPDGRAEHRYLVAPNLYIYVRSLKGGALAKQWQYRTQVDGKRRWLSMGAYPEVGLAEAERQRFGHDRVREAARKGEAEHPAIVAKKERTTQKANPTVRDVYEEWLAAKALGSSRKRGGTPVKQRTIDLHKESFADVLPVIGEFKVGKLQAADLRKCIERPLKRGSPGAARMVYKSLRELITFCIRRDYIPETAPDPMRKVDNPNPYRPDRPNVASDSEIISLLQVVSSSEMDTATKLIIEFGLLTGLRPGESRLLTWDRVHMDRAVAYLGAADVKTNQAFRLHLSPAALGVLRQAKVHAGSSPYVFAGRKENSPLGVTTVNMALRRKFGQTGLDGSGKNVKPHDLRKTFRTMLSRLDVDKDVAGLCLNHSEEEVLRRIYDGHDYRPEMIAAWNRAGAHIASLRKQMVEQQIAATEVASCIQPAAGAR